MATKDPRRALQARMRGLEKLYVRAEEKWKQSGRVDGPWAAQMRRLGDEMDRVGKMLEELPREVKKP